MLWCEISVENSEWRWAHVLNDHPVVSFYVHFTVDALEACIEEGISHLFYYMASVNG